MFDLIRHIHLVGIGGIGMSGIAEVLLGMGYEISGSDLQASPITKRLETLGVRVFSGHRAEQVGEVDLMVYSSAVREGNPELEEASRRGIRTMRRAEMLGALMRTRYGVGVAGTHGKTTTTSMIGAALAAGGLDPTVVVGGVVRDWGSTVRLGQGAPLVAEADEFDRSFLALWPAIAVVTNVEAEHLDCYRDVEDLRDAFACYVRRIPFYGAVVACGEDEGVRAVLSKAHTPWITYGLHGAAQVRADNVHVQGTGSRFEAVVEGRRLGTVELRVPGTHNVRNALAALAVGLKLGVDFERIGGALYAFSGVQRRFELKGEAGGITVVDDYAHHPTEIEATLSGARALGCRRIIAVFQPHLFSRTRDFAPGFGRAFGDADVVVLTEVYPAREEPIPGVSGQLIADAAVRAGHGRVDYVQDLDRIAGYIATLVRPGDLVITLGAGDIWKAGEALLALLRDADRGRT